MSLGTISSCHRLRSRGILISSLKSTKPTELALRVIQDVRRRKWALEALDRLCFVQGYVCRYRDEEGGDAEPIVTSGNSAIARGVSKWGYDNLKLSEVEGLSTS